MLDDVFNYYHTQARLNGLPPAEEIVTWPGLEDGLNGVRGEFAAYRPESRAAHATEVISVICGLLPGGVAAVNLICVIFPYCTQVRKCVTW